MNNDAVKMLAYWINERDAIRIRKALGDPRPWTQDPILQTYRFCNVHRDDDVVTRFIKREWLPTFSLPMRTLAAIAGRLFNRPEVLNLITAPLRKCDLPRVLRMLQAHRDSGHRTFNAAYIITTCGVKMDKLEYCVNTVMHPAIKIRPPATRDSLHSYGQTLATLSGINTFLAAQVVADLRDFAPLDTAVDAETFALSGPGSRRGLNRIYENPPAKPWKEAVWHAELLRLREKVLPLIQPYVGILHAQDLQNCLCEFDKYMRTVNNEGRPKQKHKAGEQNGN